MLIEWGSSWRCLRRNQRKTVKEVIQDDRSNGVMIATNYDFYQLKWTYITLSYWCLEVVHQEATWRPLPVLMSRDVDMIYTNRLSVGRENIEFWHQYFVYLPTCTSSIKHRCWSPLSNSEWSQLNVVRQAGRWCSPFRRRLIHRYDVSETLRL